MNRPILALLALTSILAGTTPAFATDLELDIELDPLAYALGGHSVHGGISWDHFRFDVGAFGLELPESLHGNPGFDASFAGFGAKLDWLPREDRSGLFIGIESSMNQQLISRGDAFAKATQVTLGGRIGYRVDIWGGFYVSPWVGVGHSFGPTSIEVAGQSFEQSSLLVFPTIHVGYRG
jgi:hypothetical protein